MKRTLLFGILTCLALTFGACKKKEGCTDPNALNFSADAEKNDGSCEYSPGCGIPDSITKSGYIASDETWTANNTYKIVGKVYVQSGVTLTIEPGTIIKANEGYGGLISALIVRPGGKINAVGTPQQPIIFTSILDNIQPGQLSGTTLGSYDIGLWGGVIICGNAPISTLDGDTYGEVLQMPIPTETEYGGSNSADDSGTMQYVSIRHTGALIGAGQQADGLTLAGVGSQTQISNIELFTGSGNGLSVLGGTVDVTNITVGFQSSGAIRIDENYTGTISNFAIVADDNTDEAIEVDGPKGTTYVNGMFSLENGEVINAGLNLSTSVFKEKAQGTVQNIHFNGLVKIEALYDVTCTNHLESAFTHLTDIVPSLTFTNCEHQGVAVNATCSVDPSDQILAENEMISSAATGCNLTVFANWTVLAMLGYF